MGIRAFCALIGVVMAGAMGVYPLEATAHTSGEAGNNWVHLDARTKQDRTRIANLGVAIESVRTDSVYGTATDSTMKRLRSSGIRIRESFRAEEIIARDFPAADARYHNYDELTAELDSIVTSNSSIMRKFSIGKTVQGRDIWAVQINTSADGFEDGSISAKPGIVFMGNHHAREHLSAEIPLMLIQYLIGNYGRDADITRLLDTRDVFIIPMVNPDGVEYDIGTGRYKMHRKNMRANGGWRNCLGVDLNRNYSYMWGTGGSSDDPCSDTFKGPEPFSEPETQAIKAFVENQPNLRVLLSFHTFSELILYPWGHKYEPVSDEYDRRTYEIMAQTMAQWNGYTPQQSSDLYIASGDTVDWAWGWSREQGQDKAIFSFTFELSPRDMWGGGGFYPGAEIIDRVFEDNLRPALYLMELADNPYRVLESTHATDPRLTWLR